MRRQNHGLLETGDGTSPLTFDTFFAPMEWKDALISTKGGWKEFYRSYATHVSNANVRKDQDGALMFAACQYPSPTPMNHVANNTVHVAMAKRQYDTPQPKTCIKVCGSEDIAAMERNEWTLWKHPRQEWKRLQQLLEDGKLREYERQRRLDNNTGRPMEKINNQAPQNDTKNLFKREISLLQGSETTSTWQPGELLGPSADPGTNPSLSDVFKPADEFVDKRSATFIGYAHQYFREQTSGLGWGGYDRFEEWQSYGREIPKDEVKKEYGSTDSASPLKFVD
ncbi:hypothetical protein KJ359_008471 [Pestalotiopsis sp. 9143b]|nr:hypothetical protein KJ359_008471 [Pestalotiopsis sp. 9143b]